MLDDDNKTNNTDEAGGVNITFDLEDGQPIHKLMYEDRNVNFEQSNDDLRLSIALNTGDFSVSAEAEFAGDSPVCNADIVYNKNLFINNADISLEAGVSENNGKIDYNASIGLERDFNNGLNTSVNVSNTSSDTSVALNLRKPLINPDNINNTQTQYKARKEELIENGDHFSLQTKVGYSKEFNSFYNENSLMIRIDDKNFLNSSYNQSENNRQISVGADLSKFAFDYTNDETKEDELLTKLNTLDLKLKGAKNQYNVNLSSKNTTSEENEDENSSSVCFGAKAEFNRNEYGEFQNGFNGSVEANLELQKDKVSGYRLNLDGAYNYYGDDHNAASDYLVRTHVGIEKQCDTISFTSKVSGAYRINNCNTIFEPALTYTAENSSESHNKRLAGILGVYQQVGKKFGDASVYTTLETGKSWENTGDCTEMQPFAIFNAGANIKTSKKTFLTTDVSYSTCAKWSGNLGFRYNF